MLSKKITQKTDFEASIKKGISKVADIVGQTLGPGGLPIIIERHGQQLNGDPLGPMITKDGVTVAAECADSDAETDVIIQAVKDICNKTNRLVGDGTTSAIVLGRAILDRSLDLIKKNKLNPQTVRSALIRSSSKIVKDLQKLAIPCKTLDMVEAVAVISANGDKSIGSIIRNAFESVGSEGVVTVDEGTGVEHTLEVVNGFQFRRGAEAQDRFFNNDTNTRFEAENVHVLIYDGKLAEPRAVLVVLEMLYKHYQGKMPPVLFVANDFSLDVIQALLIFKAEQNLSVCAIKGPHTTNIRTAIYDDIAVFLGGYRLGNGNRNLNNIEICDLGIANKIVVDKYTSTFFDGQGEEGEVLKRIDQLKAQREVAESPYDASLISDRLAALGEGIAKIGVGGATDLEIKEKYHRIEDAVNASRAAIEMGVIPGGGATLFRIALKLSKSSDLGDIILSDALKSPFYQIMENLGYSKDQADVIAEGFVNNKSLTYDGVSDKIVKAVQTGIIDPVKVTKTALENAISIASLLSTCGGAITYERK